MSEQQHPDAPQTDRGLGDTAVPWRAAPLISRPRCSLFLFLLLAGAANSAFFQWPLFRFAAANLDFRDAGGWLALSTVFVLQFVLTVGTLATLSLVSVRVAKVVAILIFLGNSIALYFINAYGVVLDKSMLGNVFNTDLPEATAFLHYRLLIYLGLLGAAPSLLIAWTTVVPVSRPRRGAFLLTVVLLGVAWLYTNSRSWLWVDKHASRLGALILPWSYVVNSVRYADGVTSASREQLPLPSARFIDSQAVVVVLVIGESARATNFSLYGYARPTNPLLAEAGVTALPNTRSCATYTTESLRCMLSYVGSSTPLRDSHEPLPSYVQRHGVEVTWRANNWGHPPIKVAKFESADDIRKQCVGNDCARLAYDEVLLYGLERQIRASDAHKKLVVLHTTGSHGPQYFSKYPPEFEVFKPVCRTVEQSKCSTEELVNAYDNTILYTDYFLSRVISLLKSLDGMPAVMLYVSDHGESLGEYGLYLHGTPYSIAPDVQKDIPFVVWASDSFAGRDGFAKRAARSQPRYSHDFVFHSVLGALGMTSDVHNRNLDLFGSTSENKP